ncbi:AAA family ATPase [Thermodesulfovibrionales bacterium]|nr:AAA family ATPase [Thermodesulfovibrionales bacterium]MCL0030386.1 AAA family ATPase [Thermodesulfovibrionales bacterium]MCL0040823.1 AAA family ATPase [Thermodesulfovibrionales bacterium]MCL0051448.1 AAA family ATPase [Thermodesulfovibrionales bacterium]MCL0083476.1 AAA family ATPase [Thermodesulfovibrionales bacterium]
MMKINAFKLLAYGPFTNKVLDFSGSDFGLHVVYGPNEAGKSTALRALIGLFYGFGHNVKDNWFHNYNKLVVGASLTFLDGEVLNLSRYKRRKNDLINDDIGEPFEQAKLDLHLGKIGRKTLSMPLVFLTIHSGRVSEASCLPVETWAMPCLQPPPD